MSGYIGIDNKAKKIKSLYIGVNNQARKVKSTYIGANGVAKQWYTGEIPPGPNDQYESIYIGTWNTTEDVDNFFTIHTPQNGWSGLKLGNYVTINDGTYNVDWEIAGFNMEHNQTAADGTIYDNGYGICMIPKTSLGTKMTWNNSNDWMFDGGYKASTMHTSHLVTVANNLKTILGDHLINRNVLLSSKCRSLSPRRYSSSAYEWTTAYCTLMSVGQMNGTFASNNNKYDDGEANYKLPLFNYEDYRVSSTYFWTRCIHGSSAYFYAWIATTSGAYPIFMDWVVSNTTGVRPLIYLR